MYDLTGKLIKEVEEQQRINSFKLNMTGYADGIYFAKIEMDGYQVVKKIGVKIE